VFDIRRTFRYATATGILTLITALFFFAALVIAQELELESGSVYVVLSILAVGVALAYIPFRRLAESIINRFVGSTPSGVSQQLRKFSENITGVVELDALVDVTMHTLAQVLRVRARPLLVRRNR
jgi:hypothetical protein